MKRNQGAYPAYPGIDEVVDERTDLHYTTRGWPGMSTRLRIASEQMAGIVGSKPVIDAMTDYLNRSGMGDDDLPRHVAQIAFEYADALLAADGEGE